jgi:hypothetical protein
MGPGWLGHSQGMGPGVGGDAWPFVALGWTLNLAADPAPRERAV